MSASFTYMGTKRKIAADVGLVISSCRAGALLDVFAGISAVGSSVSPHRHVWCNDVQHFAHTLAASIFTSRQGPKLNACTIERVQYLSRLNQRQVTRSIRDLLQREERSLVSDNCLPAARLSERLVALSVSRHSYSTRRLHRNSGLSRPYRLFTTTYAGGYIGLKQAVDLDSVRYAIDTMRVNKEVTGEQHRWLLLGLCRALTKVAHTTGHFAQYLAIKEKTYQRFVAKRRRDVFDEWRKAIDDMSPEGTPVWRRGNRVFRMDAVSLLESFPHLKITPPSVIYADPPYTTDHYSRYYHLLDTLILYDYPDPIGKGQYRSERFMSEFSMRTRVHTAFHKLVAAAAHLGCELVINYPANGLLSDPRQTILEILRQYFRRAEVALAIAHQHSSLGASKGVEKSPVTEFVFFAR